MCGGMDAANDNSELEEQNILAARSIMQAPPEPLTAELEPNPPMTAVLTSVFDGVITINNLEDS